MAVLEYLPSLSLSTVSWLFLAYWMSWSIYCRTLHPLACIPGPLWPSISRTWLMFHIYRGDLEIAETRLHAKYGSLVRIAPNEVSSSDPAAVSSIYRTHGALKKSDYYPTFRLRGVSKQADLFSDTDEVHHAMYRKIVAPAYQLSSILKNEDAIDECTDLFVLRMREFAHNKESVDFGLWLEMYGYDVIGRLLYGQKFGFIEQKKDIGNYIDSIERALPLLVFAAVGPSYARPIVMMIGLFIPGILKSLKALDSLKESAITLVEQRSREFRVNGAKQLDIMNQLFKIIQEKATQVDFTDKEVIMESWVGLFAGADSVAIALRSVFYYLMKHPEAMTKAANEVKHCEAAGCLSSPVKYSETINNLPYICAVIKEASRIFPSFAIHMPRIAPAEGLQLGGYHIPAGYRIGMNVWVVQQNKLVFGSDANIFKPERWLESSERNFAMEKGMLNFGAGTRTCSGKYIALTELHKLVPEILRQFHIEMAHNRPWKTRNSAFLKQKDVIVNFTPRQ